jgi:hypothetical protein
MWDLILPVPLSSFPILFLLLIITCRRFYSELWTALLHDQYIFGQKGVEEETYFCWSSLFEIVHMETLEGDGRIVRWIFGRF